jgi:RNA ligase (TIGR02306 family)
MGYEIKRKLASIQRILEVKDIEGADLIQCYQILGWHVVGKKCEFSVDDLVVYISIDAFIPTELAPFLTKNAAIPREYNGVRGERLRTVRLKGQISQGLILPLSILEDSRNVREGDDVTEILGVQKWEPPISANLAGQVRGNFPSHITPKTDQERIQNFFRDVRKKPEATYEVTLKIDGSSMTVFRLDGVLRVCSRNMELLISEENAGNSFVAMALSISDKIPEGLVFQGEIWGEGIQGNKEGIKGHRFSVFDVYDIKNQRYLNPVERRSICAEIGLEHVPVISDDMPALNSVQEFLEMADGPSIHAKLREGLVWKCNQDPSFSFKAISNRWLIKNED